MTYEQKQTIMIVEDDEDLAEGIRLSLNSSAFSFYLCSTVAGAKELFLKHRFDLLILDINLPDGSGLSLCRDIRRASRIPIVLLTAKDMEMDIVAGLESGADDYITKPFSLSVLLLKIEAFFKRSAKEGAAGILYSGALRFNQGEMKLSIDDLEVSLSKSEWRLLGLFLNHPKQILSKRQILEHVFDMEGEFVDENTLAVNIRRLREKIEEQPAKPVYIKNIRWLGYVWDMRVRR